MDQQVDNLIVKKPFLKRWYFWLIAVFVIFSALFTVRQFAPENGSTTSLDSGNEQQKNCKSNPKPVFTAEFTDLSKIQQLAPLGSINAGSPGRAYVFIDHPQGELSPRVPFYAPIDATLEGIVHAVRVQNDPTARGEYRLDFRVSCEVTLHFDHIAYPVNEIKALAPAEPVGNTGTVTAVNFPVKAGQLLGYTDGAMKNGSWDFFLINKSKEVPHINSNRWIWEQTKYADCPYDYYGEDLKAKHYAKLRAVGGEELNPLTCGSPSHDIAGTASGGWFRGDSASTAQGFWMEIANATKKTEINIREKGMSFFTIRDYRTQPLPDKLTVGESVCYKDMEGSKWAYVRLDSETKLSLAKGTGSCPSAFPSDNAEEWER